jgi:hypothetical protein
MKTYGKIPDYVSGNGLIVGDCLTPSPSTPEGKIRFWQWYAKVFPTDHDIAMAKIAELEKQLKGGK